VRRVVLAALYQIAARFRWPNVDVHWRLPVASALLVRGNLESGKRDTSDRDEVLYVCCLELQLAFFTGWAGMCLDELFEKALSLLDLAALARPGTRTGIVDRHVRPPPNPEAFSVSQHLAFRNAFRAHRPS
jgi:hypothetical protein